MNDATSSVSACETASQDDALPGMAPALDPELAAQLTAVRAHKEKHIRLRDRIQRERRVLIPLLGLAILMRVSLRMAKVEGHSMEPTYHTGDTLWVLKTYRYVSPIKPGDIVVVQMRHGKIKGEEIVKRVVFVQNDKGDAHWPSEIATRNGPVSPQLFFQPYVDGKWLVPPNSVMLLGDNSEYSMDSRDFGPVLSDEIDGKVMNH